MTGRDLPALTPMGTLRWALVQDRLEAIAPQTVLEIGCGQGAVGARLARRSDYTGVEPDEQSARTAAQRVGGRGTVVHGPDTAVEAGRTWDLVCAFEVLEHLQDDRAALERWVRWVRPGGSLLLSVPAWPSRFGAADEKVGHYRRYSPDALAGLLRDAGFVDVRATLYGWPAGYALEAVRNRIAARRPATAAAAPEERSATSGRYLQPSRWAGAGVRVAMAPFARLQKAFPSRGTGLVVTAVRPAG